MVQSWYDGVPQQVSDDMDVVFQRSVEIAADMLSRHGTFQPLSVRTHLDGSGAAASIPDVDPAVAAEQLWSQVAAIADQVLAFTITIDVRLPESGGDAVRAYVGHRVGIAYEFMLPYRLPHRRTPVDFGKLSMHPAERHLWPRNPS